MEGKRDGQKLKKASIVRRSWRTRQFTVTFFPHGGEGLITGLALGGRSHMASPISLVL